MTRIQDAAFLSNRAYGTRKIVYVGVAGRGQFTKQVVQKFDATGPVGEEMQTTLLLDYATWPDVAERTDIQVYGEDESAPPVTHRIRQIQPEWDGLQTRVILAAVSAR